MGALVVARVLVWVGLAGHRGMATSGGSMTSPREPSEVSTALGLTRFPRFNIPHGCRRQLSFEQLAAGLREPETFRPRELERDRANPGKWRKPSCLGGWSPVVFRGDYRALRNVEAAFAIGLDFDGRASIEQARALYRGTLGLLHSSFNHSPAQPRFRVVLILSRPVNATAYAHIWDAIAREAKAAGAVVDPAARDASRFWYAPAVVRGGEYAFEAWEGVPIDVDAMLALRPVSPTGQPPARPADEWAALIRDGAPEGCRNDCVARLAGYLLRRRPAPRVVLELIRAWSESRCRPPLSEDEILRTVDSICRAEAERRSS
jgi:hypothetical protein